MIDTSTWPQQMDAIAERITRAAAPLLLAEFADTLGNMNPFQQRVRLGHFVKRGWLAPHRKGGAKSTARYTVGNASWHQPIRVVHRDQEQPPEHAAARLQALVQRYRQVARTLKGEEKRHAQVAAQGAQELIEDLRGVSRLEEGAA